MGKIANKVFANGNTPGFIVGALILFSFAGAIFERNLPAASIYGQDTLIITRNSHALSGVMRLNGSDVPLANITESNGLISFSATFPVTLGNNSRSGAARPTNNAVGDLIKSTDQPETPITFAEKPLTLVDIPILPPAPASVRSTGTTPTAPLSVPADVSPRLQVQLPTGQHYGLRNRNSRITLRVHRPTRIAVQGTRNRIFIDRPLAAGDTYRVPNLVGLRLSAPDAGAIELILDGSSLGFAGEDGVAARGLSLNPQNIVDHQQRS